MYYTIINDDFVTFLFPSFSQGVTNQSTVDSSIINGNKKNGSSVTVINAVSDINYFNDLDDWVKEDDPDLFIALENLCYNSDLTNFPTIYDDLKRGNQLTCIMTQKMQYLSSKYLQMIGGIRIVLLNVVN